MPPTVELKTTVRGVLITRSYRHISDYEKITKRFNSLT